MGSPTAVHEHRVTLLRAVAALTGCTVVVDQLVDGCRPDLLAVDLDRRRVMIGDAKAAEHPRCTATAGRLLRYVAWLNAAYSASIDATFLLCCPPCSAGAWAEQIALLVHDATLEEWTLAIDDLGGDALVTARPRNR